MTLLQKAKNRVLSTNSLLRFQAVRTKNSVFHWSRVFCLSQVAVSQNHLASLPCKKTKLTQRNYLGYYSSVPLLYLRFYGPDDELVIKRGQPVTLAAGASHTFTWLLDDSDSHPIAEIGLEISHERRADGTIYLDYLAWDGTPDLILRRPAHNGELWRLAWVNGVDQYLTRSPEALRVVQNEGRGC